MIKGLLTIGLGVAAIGLVRFFASAIAEERGRRHALHHHHETTRWEGEGGNLVVPQTAAGNV
ncbi:MAG: hypothetical protein M3Z31_10435 [Pseudomonadota bacterium]|nr:hypothetical protein [Pseudomonadota bacterium]